MPTRIFDADAEALPDTVGGLDGYSRALFLIRRRGIPIGQVYLPVAAGRVDGRELREAVAGALAAPLTEAWTLERLGLDPAPAADTALVVAATVAVCTRERPDDLVRCLEALAAMPDDGHEILVVDNRPATDATRKVVSRFPSVRYVREDRRGADAARNRALREARGEVVAFIDDDAVPDQNWLRALAAPLADPGVQCVTGLTMPLELETEAQEMFEALSGFSRRGFRRRVFQSPPLNPLAVGDVGASVNMAVRRSVAERLGGFDEALDAGTATQTGGDHEFYTRMLRAGHRIVYEPTAVNWHRHRRTWEELRQTMYRYGVGAYAAWTRSLLVERDWGVIPLAFGWFWHDQAPRLLRSLLRPNPRLPPDLLWAELRGCWSGPLAYLRSRREARLDARG